MLWITIMFLPVVAAMLFGTLGWLLTWVFMPLIIIVGLAIAAATEPRR